MSTDKTPRDADETLALPVTDPEPPTASDDTTVLPVEDTTVLSVEDTTVLPVEDTTPADDTEVLPVEDTEPATDDTAVLAPDETRPVPRTSAWSSQPEQEPAAYTSPIGALYASTDRPEPVEQPPAPPTYAAPAAVVYDEPAEPAEPVAPPRRLRVGTVVWGLVIAAIGVGLLAWAAGFAIDLQLAMIVLLAVAGTALLVGSIVSGARAARR
jgi:hypothetical protein